MKLAEVVAALARIAPLQLAADWDNVGLLLEPRANAEVRRVLLTIDLTEAVLSEARALEADLIIAYHPPIFAGVQRLTQQTARERSVLKAIEQGIAIYSPHTALDAAVGGVNDWLADGLGKGRRVALQPTVASGALARRKAEGQGRLVHLQRALTLDALVRRIKRHLGLARVRVAVAAGSQGKGARPIASIALCAGAGASVVMAADADVLLTGEMRHHDVLAATERGAAVVLTEHSNSERGYLPRFARRLRVEWGRVPAVHISRQDREPLSVR